MNRALFNLIAYLTITISFGACAGLPVRGKVGDQTIETRVDSEAARYYLARYLTGERDDAALDERINRLYRSARSELPDRAELKRVSDEFSIDFAALYLADRIARGPINRRFRAQFDQALAFTRETFAEARVSLSDAVARYEFLFVPGFLYKRHPATGADFATPRRALRSVGLAEAFVETIEDGAIEANADLVAAAVRQRAQAGRRLIVVSASKSGPEVALALTRLGPAETRHVAAWVNIVGTLQGSVLADNGLWEQMEDVIGKMDIAGVESLTTTRSRERFLAFRIPQDVLVVNYIGIPLSGSLSSWARSGYSELKKDGPNDGLSLLSDLIMPHSVTLAELGRDHFLLHEAIDIRTVALAITVSEWLEENKATAGVFP